MFNEDLHISNQELLLAADGELPKRRVRQVHAHLAACWSCRARMAEIETTIVDFARTHRQTLDPQLPPVAGPRSLLRAQLAELASKRRKSSSRWLPRFIFSTRGAAISAAVLTAVVAGCLVSYHSMLQRGIANDASVETGAVPNRDLTPGATRHVAISEICSMPHEQVIADVSAPLRQQVLQEYGIANARPDDFEIDYLIAPGLGGVENIRNLWPQPYGTSTWNASVKDALEERLHQLVCAHQLDLSTAQRDIATDWIAAYKKYFHTDRPLSLHSRVWPLAHFGGTPSGVAEFGLLR